ncbi:MAG TPA: efflux transporter outer membrane subunit [Bryobacteraceae bacterium]|nr:efflux transporter outer membrane subunit [Bryobacteraceae bacterium]
MKGAKMLICAPLGALVFLGGCSMSPRYSRPKTPVPPAWQGGGTDPESQRTAGAPAAPDVKWQDFFADQKLQKVIDLALNNNRDLRIAALNVARVEAQYQIQRAQQYPTVAAAATGNLYRFPKGQLGISQSFTYQQYNVNLATTSWEVDLFGRIRSLKSGALEQYLASEQARSASQIALVAAVATSYLALGADRDNQRLAQDTLNAQQATYELILRMRDRGISSDLDLRQAQSQVEAARVDIARYTGQIALDQDALHLLVGATVPDDLLPGELGSDRALKDVSAGLSSDVLLRRPDILMAEHQLKGAYANIGAARAAYFPQIALTGGGGLISASLSNLFTAGARTWTFAPQVSLPIFDAGARRANLQIAKVDRDSAVAEYEKAIQAAFREVNDSLSQRTWLLEQQNAQQAMVNTLQEMYNLSEARYKAGIDSYLTVLVAQRSLYSAQQLLLGVRLSRLSNLVTLYKVLGGGA